MKRFYLFALLLAGAMSSCSKNEVTEVLPASDNINAIGMSVVSNATRGVETTTTTMEAATKILLDYWHNPDSGATSGSITDLAQDGDDASVWMSQSRTWDEIKFPVTFYSLHNGGVDADDAYAAFSVTNSGAAYSEYTVAGTVSNSGAAFDSYIDISQNQDLIALSTTLTGIPHAGIITGAFQHAQSRIEIYSDQGDYIPYIKSTIFMNLKNKGSLSISNESVCTWGSYDAPMPYLYFNNVDINLQLGSEDEAKSTALLTKDRNRISDVAVDGSYTIPSDPKNNMIIIPQTVKSNDFMTCLEDYAIDPVVGESKVGGGTYEAADVFTTAAYTNITTPYIQVLYRMRNINDAGSAVGYLHASDCYAYREMKAAGDEILPSGLGDDSHLYALVGFPFVSEQIFAPGFDYDIYIGLGVTGGKLLYGYYFASNGQPTNIKIANINPGDDVLATKDSPIGIDVDSDAWSAAASTVNL
ncbi:MAG: hypothetical protein SNI32_07720 [Rikenellaceae bacterium]